MKNSLKTVLIAVALSFTTNAFAFGNIYGSTSGSIYGRSYGSVYVQPYTRSNGTNVSGHYRTLPDGNCYNNLSGC